MAFIHSGYVLWVLLNIAVFLRISAATDTCERDFTSSEGTVSSPNFPMEYGTNEQCTYRITVPSSYRVLLVFHEFELEKHAVCSYDQVDIYDGDSALAPNLGTFCGYETPPPILSRGNKMTIGFKTDGSGQYKGFNATFQKVTCGNNSVAERGRISSPNYPNQYDPNSKCIYIIRVPEGRVALLSFSTFQLEQEDSCAHDYVKVYDGGDLSSPTLGTFCGFSTPASILSSTNKIIIEFRSNQRNQNKGFMLSYETVPCVRNYVSDEGTISSPNYPALYNANEKCYFKMAVPEGYRLLLSFQDFQLERHRTCSPDQIKIYDGADLSSPSFPYLCGVAIPRPILFSGNKAIMLFRSDATNEYRGFSAKFQKVKCGQKFVSQNGTISSPNFPNKYSPNERCLYTITVPRRKIVLLSFHVFELETQEECAYDSIKIYDEKVNLGTFCGSTIPGPIVSPGNSVTIDFRSDDSNEYKGFSVEFTSGILCASSNCENGGTCIVDEINGTSQCICRHGYRGIKCEEKILCSDDTCENGGICTQDGLEGTITCSCQYGYQGLLCERSFLCDSNTCKNGGTCTIDNLSGTFSCVCRHGYRGPRCTEKILCSDDTCVNGGVCTQDGMDEIFRCTCQHGYEGHICDKKIVCDATSCENGGTCTQDGLNGIFRCTCRTGYKGARCEERITCDSETCKNGGTCIQDGLNELFRCACGHGYQGLTCVERIMCQDNPCENGGSCTQDGEGGVYRCTCKYGYSGKTCEEIGSSFLTIFYVGIAGVVVGAVTCILAIFIIITTKRKRAPVIRRQMMEKDCDLSSPNANENTYELI